MKNWLLYYPVEKLCSFFMDDLIAINQEDYSLAKKTLAAIENPNADTYYLTAVLGARTDNAALIYDGLKNAIKLDPSIAAKAASDLEFAKFGADAAFQNLLK